MQQSLLGASKVQAFSKVLLPAVYPGLFAGALLSFSVLFGEFVLINLVVGSRFETVQIYLMKKLSTSGHIASSVVFVYLVLMGILTFAISVSNETIKRCCKYMSYVVIEGLHKKYGTSTVLSNIDMTIEKGEFVTLTRS